MNCSQCKVPNAIGSKFCRECGAPLAAAESPLAVEDTARAERERVSERVAAMLSAAFTLAEQKRYDQALPLAEEAVRLLPDSTPALSLLSTLYEYTGEDEKAIRALERVVALNPESPADRQKLEQLRQGARRPDTGDPEPVRHPAPGSPLRNQGTARIRPSYVPYALAGAAAACVLGIGLALVNHRTETARATSGSRATGPSYEQGATLQAPVVANLQPSDANPAPVRPSVSAEAGRDDPFVHAGGMPLVAPDHGYSAASALPTYRTPPHAPRQFAPANSIEDAADTPTVRTLPPIIAVPPAPTPGGYGVTESAPASGFGSGRRISVGAPGADATPAAAAAPAHEGYIHITVGAPGTTTTAAPSRGAADSGSPLARAQRLQGAGKYGDAVTAYREALGDSNAAGQAQQGMAQSLERQGNDAGARAAYREALRAYKTQLSAGHNVSAARSGIAACNAALEALGE